MRISDWSSDVCSSDLQHHAERLVQQHRLLAEQGYRCRDLLRREHALRVAFEPVDPVDRAQHFGDQRIGAAFADILHDALDDDIGRTSCRERVVQYVLNSVVADKLKIKKMTIQYIYIIIWRLL